MFKKDWNDANEPAIHRNSWRSCQLRFRCFRSIWIQGILNQNMPWSWAGPLDEGHRYGIIMSTHILDPVSGSYSGHTDLFNGHSILAPLHWIVDVGIGHIPGVNLDFGCKAGS